MTNPKKYLFSATHLSNQCYSMCIRRASGMCGICFYPTIITPTPAGILASAANQVEMFIEFVLIIAVSF